MYGYCTALKNKGTIGNNRGFSALKKFRILQRNGNLFKVSQEIYETSKKVFYNLDKSFESVLCSYETFKKVSHSLQKKVQYGTIFF